MNRTDTLRQNGYRTDEQGRVLARSGLEYRHYDLTSWRSAEPNAQRFEQSWLVVVRVDVHRESKDARAIVDAIVASADSPRALVGRTRSGSAILVYRCPAGLSGANSSNEYGTYGGVRLSVAVESAGASVDVAAYDWAKRGPLEIDRDGLATYTPDVAALVTAAALAAGCVSWFQVERAREDEANSARYANARLPTAQELAEAEEDRIVAAHEGESISATDGALSVEILRCRKAVARRRAARGEAA